MSTRERTPTMSAKDAVLQHTGSHHISDDVSSRCAEGIGKEEVYLYFTAKWRGKPVTVTVSADRYAASFYDGETDTSTSRLTDWRVYARDARFYDPDRNGGRGEATSDTARSALSKLCEPLAVEWLASDAYTASFQAALGRMIMRHFRDNYSASWKVGAALAEFASRLAPDVFTAIGRTLDAYNAYTAAAATANQTISGTN